MMRNSLRFYNFSNEDKVDTSFGGFGGLGVDCSYLCPITQILPVAVTRSYAALSSTKSI